MWARGIGILFGTMVIDAQEVVEGKMENKLKTMPFKDTKDLVVLCYLQCYSIVPCALININRDLRMLWYRQWQGPIDWWFRL